MNNDELIQQLSNLRENIDQVINILKGMEKIKEEITVIRDRECLENDSFDEYSEGRYDVACECLRIIDKYLAGDRDEKDNRNR